MIQMLKEQIDRRASEILAKVLNRLCGLVFKRVHGFTIANLSSRLTEGGQQFKYRMTIKSRDRKNAEKLSNHLRGLPEVVEFRIAPTGD